MKKLISIIGVFAVLVFIIILGESDINPNFKTNDSEPRATAVFNEEVQEPYSRDNIYVFANQSNIDIYVKGSAEDSDRYIRYQLSNSVKEIDRDAVNSNYDVWTLTRADEYQRTRKSTFNEVKQVVLHGEWEMAIKEQGANDFVGGVAHGDEITTSFQLNIDGKEIDLSEGYNNEAKELVFTTESDLFRDNTITVDLEQIGTHHKEYTFNKDGLTIEQQVVFSDNLILDRSYLAMLPIMRQSDDGEQITNVAYVGEEIVEQDVTDEFEIEEQTANIAVISGEESGITATVEILDKATEIPSTFFVTNAPQYNKLYFSYIDNGHQVYAGEDWRQTTHYDIDTTN